MKEAQQTHRNSPDGSEWERRVITKSFSLYPRDIELLEWLAEHLGTSQSEALRTAVRSICLQLAQITPKKREPTGATTDLDDSIN